MLPAAPPIHWIEDFSSNPVADGRFYVPAGHDAGRFTYNGAGQRLTVHYDTFEPTAWYMRPVDSIGSRVLSDCDDFEFSVTFRVRSAGFFADPDAFAQIGWSLINSTTTGEDRAGGSAGPYAFDCVGFDYFPNVSPTYGGPTLGATVIHSNQGQGFFSAIEFPFGDESELKMSEGDQGIALDTFYTGRVVYDSGAREAVLTVHDGSQFRAINSNGGGGPGGPDGNPATIQTQLFSTDPFQVNSFALTAWQDTFNEFGSSVVADVDVTRVEVTVAAFLKGDLNRDGVVDSRDVRFFIQLLFAAQPDPCLMRRADFTGDGQVTPADIPGFEAALLNG